MITEELQIKITTKENWDKVVECMIKNGNNWWSGSTGKGGYEGYDRAFTHIVIDGVSSIALSGDNSLLRKEYTADQFLEKYGHKFKVGDMVRIVNPHQTIDSYLKGKEFIIESIRIGGGIVGSVKSFHWEYWGESELELVEESTLQGAPYRMEELYKSKCLDEGLKAGDIIKLEGRFIYKTEDSRDGNVGGVKKVMSRVRSFIKSLTLSSEDKLLREYGFQNECGDYTEDARELVISKLVADNKAYIVEIAQGMKEEDKERNEKK